MVLGNRRMREPRELWLAERDRRLQDKVYRGVRRRAETHLFIFIKNILIKRHAKLAFIILYGKVLDRS